SWNEFWERLKRVLGVRRPSVHVPVGAMRVQATLTERLPGAPVTRDQLTMLELGDNVVSDANAAVETFGLTLVPLDEQLRPASWSPGVRRAAGARSATGAILAVARRSSAESGGCTEQPTARCSARCSAAARSPTTQSCTRPVR